MRIPYLWGITLWGKIPLNEFQIEFFSLPNKLNYWQLPKSMWSIEAGFAHPQGFHYSKNCLIAPKANYVLSLSYSYELDSLKVFEHQRKAFGSCGFSFRNLIPLLRLGLSYRSINNKYCPLLFGGLIWIPVRSCPERNCWFYDYFDHCWVRIDLSKGLNLLNTKIKFDLSFKIGFYYSIKYPGNIKNIDEKKHKIWEHHQYKERPDLIFKPHLYRPTKVPNGYFGIVYHAVLERKPISEMRMSFICPVFMTLPLRLHGILELQAGILIPSELAHLTLSESYFDNYYKLLLIPDKITPNIRYKIAHVKIFQT